MFIGIDPGLAGALAVLAPDGTLQALCDTPVFTLATSRGTTAGIRRARPGGTTGPLCRPQSHVVIEEAQAMPGQGTRSMFTIGVGFGVWLGLLAALALPPYQGTSAGMEACAGSREGQRAGTAQSPAALPCCRPTAQEGPREGCGTPARRVWLAARRDAGAGPCTTRWRTGAYHRGARMVVCTLKRILATRGLSQRALARRSGVHRATIARLCRDDWATLDRYVLNVLCECLHITPQTLLVWQDDDDEEDELA